MIAFNKYLNICQYKTRNPKHADRVVLSQEILCRAKSQDQLKPRFFS